MAVLGTILQTRLNPGKYGSELLTQPDGENRLQHPETTIPLRLINLDETLIQCKACGTPTREKDAIGYNPDGEYDVIEYVCRDYNKCLERVRQKTGNVQ
jgi:hypothetical protein